MCFLNLPVQELNSDFLPVSHVNHTKYLTPRDRLLTPHPIVVPCSEYFAPKFKSTTGQYIAYTKNGVEKVLAPSTVIDWGPHNELVYEMNTIEPISFDVGEGLYDFNKTTEYEILSIFSGAEDQIISSLTRTATESVGYDVISQGVLQPENFFPNYPWDSIKKLLLISLFGLEDFVVYQYLFILYFLL